MPENKFNDKIKAEEHKGEKLISNVRLILAFIYIISVPVISIVRNLEGYGYLPWRAHIWNNVFFIYSVFLFIYVRKKDTFHKMFKYICVILDMTLISATIWIGCTYPELTPAIPYLSIWALFYNVLILAGSFRYDIRCAYFSGIFSSIMYFLVVFIQRDAWDLPYSFIYNNQTVNVNFPIYNEIFRAFGMIVTGVITGMAGKRRLTLFKSMLETEHSAAKTASKTVDQTRIVAKTISKSTDEIFISSKDILTTANSQAITIQEIETTVNENSSIAADIAEKTGSVAGIASKMETDVNVGLAVLKRNITQMENIKSKNDGVIYSINNLCTKITKIHEIVKSINTITDQTKVIAFNAALEAAGAGAQGRRFSVVSSEVNRLADDIAVLTSQIREQIDEIQKSSYSLITSSEESAENINEGNNLIKELEGIFSEILNGAEITSNQAQTITVSTQKHQRSSEQISIAIKDISTGLSNFLRSTEIATSSAEKLTQMIIELEKLLSVNDAGIL